MYGYAISATFDAPYHQHVVTQLRRLRTVVCTLEHAPALLECANIAADLDRASTFGDTSRAFLLVMRMRRDLGLRPVGQLAPCVGEILPPETVCCNDVYVSLPWRPF